jgi:hypothetical protein
MTGDEFREQLAQQGLTYAPEPPASIAAPPAPPPAADPWAPHVSPALAPPKPMPAAPPPPVADIRYQPPANASSAPPPEQTMSTMPLPQSHMVGASNVPIVDPRTQKEIHGAYGNLGGAIKAEADQGGRVLTAKGSTQNEIATRLFRQRDEAQQRIKDGKGNFEQNLAKLAAVDAEAQQSGAIDPEHWDKTRTPGEKFMMGLAAALTGFSAGFNHQTGNSALEHFAALRNNDIKAQEFNASGHKVKAQGFRDQLDYLMKERDHDERVIHDADAMELAGVNALGTSNELNTAGDQVRAGGDVGAAKVGVEDAQSSAHMNHYVPAHAVGGVSAADQQAMDKYAAEMFANGRAKSTDEARQMAIRWKYGPRGLPTGDMVGHEKGTPEDKASTVIVGGAPRLAVNPQAAKDYKEYQDSAPDVTAAFERLRKAWKDGSPGAYEAARGQLIDSMPKFMLGSSASGPTKAQALETYGKMVPDYRHWYNPTDGTFTQNRTDEAFAQLEAAIHQRSKTIEETTFPGAPTPKAPATPTGFTDVEGKK